jgi:hypothetical protein
MKNNTITWQYAQNFDENEKRWEEVKTLLIAKMRVITKNALLSMAMIDDCIECTDMVRAIESGDRSEFLYKKAKKAVENAASLEEAGEMFYKAFSIALNKKLNEQD